MWRIALTGACGVLLVLLGQFEVIAPAVSTKAMLSQGNTKSIYGGACYDGTVLGICAPQSGNVKDCSGKECVPDPNYLPPVVCPAGTLGKWRYQSTWGQSCSPADTGRVDCPSDPIYCEIVDVCSGCSLSGLKQTCNPGPQRGIGPHDDYYPSGADENCVAEHAPLRLSQEMMILASINGLGFTVFSP